MPSPEGREATYLETAEVPPMEVRVPATEKWSVQGTVAVSLSSVVGLVTARAVARLRRSVREMAMTGLHLAEGPVTTRAAARARARSKVK